jgi:hypothetical protein
VSDIYATAKVVECEERGLNFGVLIKVYVRVWDQTGLNNDNQGCGTFLADVLLPTPRIVTSKLIIECVKSCKAQAGVIRSGIIESSSTKASMQNENDFLLTVHSQRRVFCLFSTGISLTVASWLPRILVLFVKKSLPSSKSTYFSYTVVTISFDKDVPGLYFQKVSHSFTVQQDPGTIPTDP